MIALTNLDRTWAPRLLGVLRIVTALLFLEHGTAKLFGLPHVTFFDNLPLFSLIGFAGVLEVVGGLLLLVGFWTRPTAFVLSGEMAVAYFMVHAKMGAFPIVNHGEPAVLYCWFFLFVLFYGPGRWSVDALLFKRASSTAAMA